MYKVVYADAVEKDLKALDKPAAKKILDKIEHYLAKDPHTLGRQLVGEFKGFWRFRFGDYRVVYRIADKEILIIVVRIAHRKDVYET